MRWQATVVQMDGRRIDLLELTESSRTADTDRAGPLMNNDIRRCCWRSC